MAIHTSVRERRRGKVLKKREREVRGELKKETEAKKNSSRQRERMRRQSKGVDRRNKGRTGESKSEERTEPINGDSREKGYN